MPTAAIIGWPVDHARSPLIHEHWLSTMGLKGRYIRIPVAPDEVKSFFGAFKDSGLVGCNITLPHKHAALACVSDVLPAARAIGAANTVWVENGALRATNTDAEGFMRSLDLGAPQWKASDRPVLVLGAGGAARAVVFGLLEAGVRRIIITNRTQARAEVVARDLGTGDRKTRITVSPWLPTIDVFRDVGLVVNTTTLGMKAPSGTLPPINVDLLRADTVVVDAVYVPLMTPLLAAAARRGLTTVDGLGMLLHQAVPAFERFYGAAPTVTPTLRALAVADIEGK